MKLHPGDTLVIGHAVFVAKKMARSNDHNYIADGIYLGNATHSSTGKKFPRDIPVLIFCHTESQTLSVKAHTPIGNWMISEVPYQQITLIENAYQRTA